MFADQHAFNCWLDEKVLLHHTQEREIYRPIEDAWREERPKPLPPLNEYEVDTVRRLILEGETEIAEIQKELPYAANETVAYLKQFAIARIQARIRRLKWKLPPPPGQVRLDKDAVRDRFDFRGYCETAGLRLRGNGQKAVTSCPFHSDRLPSLSLDFAKKVWCCHAGCGGGDCFSFVMKLEGIGFSDALKRCNTI